MLKKIITAFLTLFLVAACGVLEDLGAAKNLVKEKRYEKAIELLNQYKGTRAKNYNSEVHEEYALYKLSDLKIDKQQRYKEAKELLDQAIKLNPKNLEAKNYYLMTTKTLNYEFPESN